MVNGIPCHVTVNGKLAAWALTVSDGSTLTDHLLRCAEQMEKKAAAILAVSDSPARKHRIPWLPKKQQINKQKKRCPEASLFY